MANWQAGNSSYTVQRYILARTSATANRSLVCGCIR